ncbi:Hsp70 family protein [Paracraurococcus ruber]|uniref:Hsp70 family protein n=2 Tax=Paracraurococcus ruber TaxID=77675 RepID=A0ABS1CYG2_9PROT|nr:Hsp70 family protein [Paracraurococcus ruber]MBK1659443.1 hsp70 family protein [Paracraurococcus ruber]TDG31157.1 Hsp70 family protein [Paracraurococcus ruber]
MRPSIGIDFGTTNSVVAALRPDGSVATLAHDAGAVFRSVLCLWLAQGGQGGGKAGGTRHAAGPAAIEAYLEDPLASRLIMSMKSYLAQRSFRETRIHGRAWTLEALVAAFLRELLGPFAADLAGARVVVGRPVRFAGETADDGFGEERLRAAFAAAGLPEVQVALEPAAAGHRFAAGLDRPATVLVGDMGGGTSDISLLRFEPGPPRRVTPLGHAGVGIAGDALDYRIIDRVVSPRLGKGDQYRVWGKPMPIPVGWYLSFARWHQLSLMRAPKVLADIAEVARTAEHPEKLRHLVMLVEEEAGYALYRAVSGVKAALSRADTAMLDFRHEEFAVQAAVARAEFEAWIAADLAQMDAAVEAALADAGLAAAAVDRVFLTGGTSLVPAVRALFERRFGAERIAGGGEFVSVAEGLALMGAEDAAPPQAPQAAPL